MSVLVLPVGTHHCNLNLTPDGYSVQWVRVRDDTTPRGPKFKTRAISDRVTNRGTGAIHG